jgi:hypothetical protein
MRSDDFGNRTTIDVPNEDLKPGPQGNDIEVIDYDAEHDLFYAPVNLDDPAVLMQAGLEPSESDPRFHQQMVYAVSMRVLENFESALGRHLRIKRNKRRLRIFPHAFHGANAFYDRKLHALLFGYFQASTEDPGRNLPGQIIFTCLSHDIIAHEMTHALIDRLRAYFVEPSNLDVLAFHEGFADLVALFQHFSYQELLRDQIQRKRTDLSSSAFLVELAQQFGYATGSGRALRSALGKSDKKLYESVTEPHERGSILVAAVFDAFFATYHGRIRDLVRIATRGSGTLPDADLHPDLVNRVSIEASRTAQAVLRMCIRAFDYLPPVDITFGDYLRALITADYELNPVDNLELRGAMIEAFRLRGIYPAGVASLAEESLLWEESPSLPKFPTELLGELTIAARSFGRSEPVQRSNPSSEEETDVRREVAPQLHTYATSNARALALDPGRAVEVHGFHSVFRVSRDGQLLIELVAQFAQSDASFKETLGGLPFRGGTTVVVSANGTVRYVIAKPLPSKQIEPRKNREADLRLDKQRAFVEQCGFADPQFAWGAASYPAAFMERKKNLAAVHQGVC